MADKRDNFGFSHKSGILMSVSSLPSRFGIGTFGAPSFDFIDFLHRAGQSVWQVLPLNPTAYGDSPYQSPSSFAGNPYFIDLDPLYQAGLLTEEELKSAERSCDTVDYGWLFWSRIPLLKTAFSRFEPEGDYWSFKVDNCSWLDDYAYFMSLKEHYNYSPWSTWQDHHKFYSSARSHRSKFSSQIEFWCFVQYLFFKQWNQVRDYASRKGVTIVGDMPIYVAYDSVEVWCAPQEFLLDERLNPTLVAGVPPDYFSPEGQLWGNPIYDWERMKKDNFKWWTKRLKQSSALYDIVRIDHFRAFAGYFVVKAGEPTAKDGVWKTGVGKELFDVLLHQVPEARIIAEDLGFITDDVRELLSTTGFPGMKVLQFAFESDDGEYLPRNYPNSNCVVYTGTHDSETTKDWCKRLKGDALARFKKECPTKKGWTRAFALIMLALGSGANLAVIPMQDYLSLGDEARMNRPSVSSGNWIWRAPNNYASPATVHKIYQATKDTDRL